MGFKVDQSVPSEVALPRMKSTFTTSNGRPDSMTAMCGEMEHAPGAM